MRALDTGIAVVGAGVIGLTVALRLVDEGHEVVLLDPNRPGSGASWGNAGTIADYATIPVGTPDVLRTLPSLLFDASSPLAIRRAALPALAPWLVRFAAQSLPGPARRNAMAIAALLADAGPLWSELASRVGGEDILRRRGCLYVYEHRHELVAARADIARRRGLGVRVEFLEPSELARLEPGAPAVEGGAAFFPDAIFLSDPGRMVDRIAGALTVPVLPRRVTGLSRTGRGVRLTGEGLDLHAGRAILAAGAWSQALARQAGDRIPLDTERGYHVEWDMAEPPLSRPLCPSARGFYFCPMSGRLRAAGTVELGGLDLPPSPGRVRKLVEGARHFFPDLPEPSRDWMGFRPSLPDSLPVIGPSRGGAEVIHAFGHGHLGVTLAPVTARLVADLVAGREPERDLAATRPDRFRLWFRAPVGALPGSVPRPGGAGG
jgi:D-hydroxyproline dehydrogenase